MPSVLARKPRNSPQLTQNPLFHHRYDNLPKRPSDTPCPSPAQASQGNPRDPNSGPPNNEDNGGNNDSNNLNPGSVHTPVPEPGSEPEVKPEDTGKVLTKALTQLAEYIDPDRQEALRVMVKEADQFNGSNQWKLQGFLLQLKLNFQAKKKSF